VFSARSDFAFDFPAGEAEATLTGAEVLLWDEAEIRLSVSSNRALRGETRLQADGRILELEPMPSGDRHVGGIRAATGDPREILGFDLAMGFNGAEALSLTPVGRETRVSMVSDWPHPEFQGAFLPDAREVREDGFEATWVIPHLARSLPQLSREDQDAKARQETGFGVGLYEPNDFYQKAYRAARYGVLFIGLTFLTIFLVEGQTRRPTHPVQYILIGLAQSAFFLLMLALAEQVGFGWAYLIAGAATVGLVTAFAAMALKLGRRTLIVGATLSVLYAVLYLILRTADYALLAGSILLFGAIAGTMFATRNENWYGEKREGTRKGWFRRPEAQTPPPVPET
jgi:inner membrane protein